MYRLRGLENEVLGKEIEILVPFESVSPVYSEIQPEKATSLRNWLVYHQAFLLEQALGTNAILSVQPGRLRIEPYQIVPVMRAIQMSRPRLLLCDAVGLGKTIQAGLVITELMARRLAHRLLVVSPAGPLLEQWKTELWERFGLRVAPIDRDKLEEIRKQTELGANPFDHIPLGLVSVDFLKQERVLDQVERTNYDIIIIDEAHHCMDLGKSVDREDSQRRKLAEVLARKCDSLLLLTATPHDGNDRSFASIIELLDPSLVDGRGILRGERYKSYAVRRLKKHIKTIDPDTGKEIDKFKEREVTPIPVKASKKDNPNFVELQKLLLDLVAPQLRRAFRNKKYDDVLSFISLLKRSVSTAEACRRTLETVSDRFSRLLSDEAESNESLRQRRKTIRDYNRKLERFGTVSYDEEQEQQELEAVDIAQQFIELERDIKKGSRELKRITSVVEAMEELLDLAEAATSEDPKISRLISEIEKIRAEEPGANIIIFTEYTDSQSAVIKALDDAKSLKGKILSICGDDPDTKRSQVTDRFRHNDNLILVSTDASAEGLNLHDRCHHLIHLELPFNPNRLEQRNGRIDRYGQTKNPIVRYFYLKGTFEERILLRLIAKYERQRSMLTFVPNTLGLTTSMDATQERLLKGIMDEDTRLFEDAPVEFDFHNPDEDRLDDPSVKDLLEEIDRSLKGFEKATKLNTWLGDEGMNAEQRLTREADEAREKGVRSGAVDIVRFVKDAVLLDGGDVVDAEAGIFHATLPPGWNYGLDDLPGYDSSTRKMRLTTEIDIMRDAAGNSVGFLGRAHPLVRRALDRVRNISFGGSDERAHDRRASAVKADFSEPHILFTFLGRISSNAGREYEQVIAVLANKNGGGETYLSADQWEHFLSPEKAIQTTDVWKNHFEKWGDAARKDAGTAAAGAFTPISRDYLKTRNTDLEKEKQQQIDWLKIRVEEITGSIAAPIQATLFGDTPTSAWMRETDPVKRLAAFASDKSNPPSKCNEADTVLRIFRVRMKDIDARSAFKEPEIIPIGLLMLMPEVGHGV